MLFRSHFPFQPAGGENGWTRWPPCSWSRKKQAGFVLAFAILNQTENELIALLGEPQPITDTLIFEPAGTVTRQGTNLTANYTAGSLAGRGLAVMGPDQQGVLFLHGRPQKDPRTSRSLLDELAELVRFTPTSDNSPAP